MRPKKDPYWYRPIRYTPANYTVWRCAACNTAVRKGQNDPCKCTRKLIQENP